MNARFRPPRLLPATIGLLALTLAARTTLLVRTAVISFEAAGLIPAARASGPEPAGKPTDLAMPPKPEAAGKKPPAAAPPRAEESPKVPEGPPPVTGAERALLLELRDRRQELEAREATLTARESMVAAAEMKLSARVQELQDLQKKLESLDANHRQQEDTAWQGLVKVYETMKPRDAAAIFNDLGMQVLVSVVDRMKEAKAAAILAAMIPEKARELTTQLAQWRTRGVTGPEDTEARPPMPAGTLRPPGSGT